MMESSPRFALPFIVPGQAQKEAFHNEALVSLDGALHACVEDDPLADPPPAPEPGQSWIVAADAAGDWLGFANALACWSVGGWRFTMPVAGMTAWNRARGYWLHWTGSLWAAGTWPVAALLIHGQQVVGGRAASISNPSGGTIIDAEARAAIDQLIATLKSHGLTD